MQLRHIVADATDHRERLRAAVHVANDAGKASNHFKDT